MNKLKIILGILIIFSARGVFAESFTTSFSAEGNYTFDSSKIEVSEGKACLKTVDFSNVNDAITADSTYSANEPKDAFDDTDSKGWGNYRTMPSWLKYDFGESNRRFINSYSLYRSSQNEGGWGPNEYTPLSWSFEGSDNDVDWNVLDSQSGVKILSDEPKKVFAISSPQLYRYYRIFITEADNSRSWVNITEMELLGASMDAPSIVKTLGDSTDSISSFTGFSVAGSDSGLYFQISQDGNDWRFWNGSSWSSAGATNFNDAATINAHISSFPAVSKKIFVKTFLVSNEGENVEVDEITVDYEFDAEVPTASFSYTPTESTPGPVIVTMTTSEEIEVPAGWTQDDSTHYTKSVSVNGTVSFDITDLAGNTTEVSYDVTNIDAEVPTITLNGANPQEITQGNAYTELGATANDAEDGNLTNSIVIDASAVDTTTVGTYHVSYTVSDTAGNTTTETRVVNVVAVQVNRNNNNKKSRKRRSSRIRYVCKNPRALNYDRFGRHKSSLCRFAQEKEQVSLKNREEDLQKRDIDNPLKGTLCPTHLLITDNMKNPSTDGRYSSYNRGTVTQVKRLQTHLNRLLKDDYGAQAAGPIDGYFRTKTKRGVERLQRKLNIILKGKMKPLAIDGIVGPYTKKALNMSC